MNPLIWKYELDLSGKDRKNRVISEYHDLRSLTGLPNRPFCLDNGYFFGNSVSVIDSHGKELIPGTDFQVTGLHPTATGLTGEEICCVIVITNPRVSTEVFVNAQMVGGEYTSMATTIVQLAKSTLNDTRTVRYQNITGKPDAFNSGGHLHALWEMFGFEPYNENLSGIIDAVLDKSRITISGVYEEMAAKYALLKQRRTRELARLLEHIDDSNNPHRVNKTQAGLGQLNNYPKATTAEASVLGPGRADRYTTPRSTKQVIDANFMTQLMQHINTTTNASAHRVTPGQLGTLSKRDTDIELQTALSVTGTAESTARLEGMTYAEIYDDTRSNLPASAVTTERFDLNRLGSGGANRDRVLVGNRTWRSIKNLIDEFIDTPPAVHFAGFLGEPEDAADYIRTTFDNRASYPDGTIIIYREQYSRVVYGGNGNQTTRYEVMKAMLRTASGWIGPH